MKRLVTVLAAALAVSSCVSPHVDVNDPGEVSGKLMVFWIGYDQFVYYPFYDDPLVYTLPRDLAEKLGTRTMRPGAIYTDGGSIPQAVRNVAGLSPWGYGPAYIMHDWLFVAHHCIVHDRVDKHDRRDREEVETVRKVDFGMSADILASVIQALVKQKKVPENALAPGAIYAGVDSVVARNLWDSRNPKSCDPPDAEVIRDIEDKLRDGARRAALPSPGDRPPLLVYQQDF
jgi:hypothetical protein